MALTPDAAALQTSWQSRLADLPVSQFRAGDVVVAEGTRTGRLFILKSGTVSVVKNDTEIAQVTEPGAVFGELSALLDQPHGADVRALDDCALYLADASQLLADPAALLYVTLVLARRLDGANRAFVELKNQIHAGEPPGVIDQALDQIEGLLNAIGSGYIRAGAGIAGYPFP
jgi:CRP-like cAMP-binding protein